MLCLCVCLFCCVCVCSKCLCDVIYRVKPYELCWIGVYVVCVVMWFVYDVLCDGVGSLFVCVRVCVSFDVFAFCS